MSKPHPRAFRRQALDLMASGRCVWDVAASLGISETCLHRWEVADWKARGLRQELKTKSQRRWRPPGSRSAKRESGSGSTYSLGW